MKHWRSYQIQTLLIGCLSSLAIISCKSSSDAFDVLGGTGSTIEQLTIEQALPDVTSLILENGQSQIFSVTVYAPIPRQPSYQWTLNGTPISSTSTASLTATPLNVGTYELKMTTNDGVDQRERTWSVKINGAPAITPVTTGTPKVAVAASRNISATATDPNNDSLSYTWTLNGNTSVYLTGTSGVGTLTGHTSIVGDNTVTLTVSDGTSSTSTSWNVQVNHFPDACNTLAQGQICTYGGSPHKGNGLAHNNTEYPLRFAPLGQTQDALGNFFISDNDHYVIWYWNRTGSAVTRLGSTIPANTIQIVAGTGEMASGSAGIPALESALNQPRGLWYNDISGVLYVAEYGGSRVKYITSDGTVYIGMGTTASHVNGDLAYNHQCNNPASLVFYSDNLYVTCYGSHRVKRWDLTTDLGYVVAGDGGNDVVGDNVAPNTGGVGNAYGLAVTADGVYIGTWTGDRIRFVNTTGGPKVFWSGNPDQVTVNAGMIATIAGNGATGAPGVSANPLSIPLANPVGIVVRNTNEIYTLLQGQHSIVLLNNTGAPITIDGRTIASMTSGRLNVGTSGYNGSSTRITLSRMNSPYDMTLDVTDPNNLIVSDYNNARLREINLTTESINDLAGSGNRKSGTIGATTAPTLSHYFNNPGGVTYDSTSDSIFFVDMNNYQIRQINSYGIVSTPIGLGTAGDPSVDNSFPTSTQMRTTMDTTNNVMNGIERLSDGSLLQINGQNNSNTVRVWNRSGADNTYFNIFVQNDRINTVAGDWTVAAGNGADGQDGLSTVMSSPVSARAYGTSLFVVDSANHCIRELNNLGIMNSVIGLCGTSGDPVSQNLVASSARLFRPKDIAFDTHGNMFISDFSNNKIRYWNRSAGPVTIGSVTVPAGNLATVACLSGSTGSNSENISAITSRCTTPTGLAIDITNNRLCYSQRSQNNVRCINLTNGLVNTVAGSPESNPRAGSPFDLSQEGLSGTSVPLYNPTGLAFDGNGDLYISDQTNHLIRKLKLTP